jgi:uncharacterized membrane protein
VWGLLVLVVIWVVVGPIFALTSATRANRRSNELLRRLEALESKAGIDSAEAARTAAAGIAQPYPPPFAAATAEPAAPAAPEAPPAEPVPAEAASAGVEPAAEPVAPEAFPTADAPAAPSPPTPPGESLETKIGARWTVLVGGLALALGAIFLVRYSIEQGLIGPAMRIALGFLLALVLFGTGEWLRRRDSALALPPAFAKADVPAILTGAAGIALFATIYAAYALYGFIGPSAAFVLLTVAGLVTLFLSVIHGPALAALGALGSYAAPLLVSNAEPAPFPVVLHVLAVTAAVLGMARIRAWRWLAVAGIAASLAWGLLLGEIEAATTVPAELLLVAGLAVIYIGALLAGAAPIGLRDRAPDLYALGALAGLSALSLHYANIDTHYPPLVSGIVLAGFLGAVASRWTSVGAAALLSGAVAIVTVMLLPPSIPIFLGVMRIGAFHWAIVSEAGLGRFALEAAAIGFVVGVGCFASADRAATRAPTTAGFFAGAGALAPFLILIVVYLRHSPFETRPAIGIAALVMAAVFATLTERLIARRPDDDMALAPALYAAGAVLALAFAFAVGLATRFIPLSLSLGAAGVVWVSLYRPVRVLSWLSVVVAGLACIAIIFGPPFTPEELGTRPILNGLILRLGLPAAAVLFAGETLRRHRDGLEAQILQTIGLVLAAIFVTFEIRHYSGGGMISTGPTGLGEQSALTLAALAFSLGLQRIAGRTKSKVYAAGSLVAGLIGALAIAIAHFFTANPLVTGESVGTGHFFNLLLPGYLLPALGAAWVAAAARPVRPRWYVLLIAALALLLGFAYVSLMVRHGFQGERLDGFEMTDAENWTYSAVWLVFGILLLAAGIFLRSTMVRAASGLVIAVVVCKVFLFDMAALTGALRAASFLGLGATLIIIGRLYQRLLMRGVAKEAAEAATPG